MPLKINENLQLLRKEKKMTQEEIAEVFGVTSQSVSKWELGLSCPDISLLPDIANFFKVSIDELLGYKPISSINNIYIQIKTCLDSIEDHGELLDTVYRINRLAGACTSQNKTDTIDKLIEGAQTNGSSMLQGYGKKYGGVLVHNSNSMFVTSFNEFKKIELSELREIYRTLNKFANMNVLKVLNALFNHKNEGFANISNGMTIEEISKQTNLSNNEAYIALNSLDIKLNDESNEERWFLTHCDTLPILMLLNTSENLFPKSESVIKKSK